MKLKAVVCMMVCVMLGSSAAWAGLTKTEVSQLYVSVFNRASEGEGNTYWRSQPDMATAAAAMLDTDAARNYFGANLNTNQAFIEHIYLNTLNKTIADDSEGIGYWVGQLDVGTSRGNVVAALVGVIKDYAPGGLFYNPEDAATVAAYNRFTNRVTVSDYMADTVCNTPEDWETATAFDSGLVVTDDPATVDAAKAVVNNFVTTSCTYSISSSNSNFTANGGLASISVIVSDPDCAWKTTNDLSWVTLKSDNGTGNGSVKIVVDTNDTDSARSGTVIIAGQTFTINQKAVNSVNSCGAYIAPGVWKEFDCYNLAAIGKTTQDDPFTPSWRLIGGHWQWGRKGPDENQWYNTNTANFAHGPTGPSESEANKNEISGWDTTYVPAGSWSDSEKTANDPCPAGYRVPTRTQWENVIDNNTQSNVGTWSISATNYSSALFFGDDLMLPAAGYRRDYDGSLGYHGYSGFYWSSGERPGDGYYLHFANGYADSYLIPFSHWNGFSVRCIAEPLLSCTYSISSSSGSFTANGGLTSISVTVSGSDCSWETTNDLSWVSLKSDNGTGNGSVNIMVDANDTDSARSGSVIIAGQTYTISQKAINSVNSCGAYIAPGVWKEFDCYNLAAIGKTTGDDPFTPSWRLIGGYWQWGRKGPDLSQWYDTDTTNFAHGPTGPDASEANYGAVSGWDSTYAPDGSWSDSVKTDNDPCPTGYRVPTSVQWSGVNSNNTKTIVGTWIGAPNNYSCALFFGDGLMLPATGLRNRYDGWLMGRGSDGRYWSSSENTGEFGYAWFLIIFQGGASMYDYYRNIGLSVRCISE